MGPSFHRFIFVLSLLLAGSWASATTSEKEAQAVCALEQAQMFALLATDNMKRLDGCNVDDSQSLAAKLADVWEVREKSSLVDPWGAPYLVVKEGGIYHVYSAGKNGEDEDGRGDDISSIYGFASSHYRSGVAVYWGILITLCVAVPVLLVRGLLAMRHLGTS